MALEFQLGADVLTTTLSSSFDDLGKLGLVALIRTLLNNSTLTNIKGFQAPKPDLTITINRTDLEAVMMGAATLDQQIASGKAKLVGDRRPYNAIVFTHQQKLFSFFVLLSIIAIIILIK